MYESAKKIRQSILQTWRNSESIVYEVGNYNIKVENNGNLHLQHIYHLDDYNIYDPLGNEDALIRFLKEVVKEYGRKIYEEPQIGLHIDL